MTNAISSFGTLLKKGDGGSPETFATVAEVGDIDGPDTAVDMEDVTNHGSSGGWKEKIPTIIDGGSISFPLNLINTDVTHNATTGLQADLKNRTKRNWRLVYPDGSYHYFAGYVNKFKVGAKVKGALKGTVGIEITGPVNLA
jgi:hypothetical protein